MAEFTVIQTRTNLIKASEQAVQFLGSPKFVWTAISLTLSLTLPFSAFLNVHHVLKKKCGAWLGLEKDGEI